MTYPSPLKAISRKLTDDIVITSTAFTRINIWNFGARMALIKYGDDIVVWSAIPHGEEVEKAIALFSSPTAKVTHLIIPDKVHTMAAKSFKDKYPDLKIIAPDAVDLGAETPIAYKVPEKSGNKILAKAELLKEIGVPEDSPLSNLQFVYLPGHQNTELVCYDAKSKTVFEADLLFNLGVNEPLEQYSPETGFPKGTNPYGGLSFLTRYMNPTGKFGKYFSNSALGSTPGSKQGIKAIYSWDFDKIVMSHGNVIESNGKSVLHGLFQKSIDG